MATKSKSSTRPVGEIPSDVLGAPARRVIQRLAEIEMMLWALRETFAELGPALRADLAVRVTRGEAIAPVLAQWSRRFHAWAQDYGPDVLNLTGQGLAQFRAIKEAAAEGPEALATILGMTADTRKGRGMMADGKAEG